VQAHAFETHSSGWARVSNAFVADCFSAISALDLNDLQDNHYPKNLTLAFRIRYLVCMNPNHP